MADEPVEGPASYFASNEKKYGRPILEWQEIVRQKLPAKHMNLFAMLKNDHGMGHGHANALVSHTWRPRRAEPFYKGSRLPRAPFASADLKRIVAINCQAIAPWPIKPASAVRLA